MQILKQSTAVQPAEIVSADLDTRKGRRLRGLPIDAITLNQADVKAILSWHEQEIVAFFILLRTCMHVPRINPERLTVPVDEANRILMEAGKNYLCKIVNKD
jgi:hypothetical protein